MKIPSAHEMNELDAYTIQKEPVESIELMERAARAVAGEIGKRWKPETPVTVYAGPGNNGGDALAVARLLSGKGFRTRCFLFNTGNRLSPDCQTNKERLEAVPEVSFTEVTSQFEPPHMERGELIVDGLFGTGLNKPLNGGYAMLVKIINASQCPVVSIDVPSGLMCEDNSFNVEDHIIRARLTLTFQLPKLAFLLPDSAPFAGEVKLLDIGLSREMMARMDTLNALTEEADILRMLRPRPAFGHKGTFGKALIVAGQYGMAGAAVLACRACLRSGAGKVVLHTAARNNDIVQISTPETVVRQDSSECLVTEPAETTGVTALAIGPGLGTERSTALAFIEQVRHAPAPVVVDADGLNILAEHKGWMQQLPEGTVLTPHPGEFRRIGKQSSSSYELLNEARSLAQRQKLYVVLKGRYTAVCTPEGKAYFNPTGNPGMATPGSGDALTGIITALLAQRYTQEAACRVGVYVHGLAGDLAAAEIGEDGLTASDIIDHLPAAFKRLRERAASLPET